MDESGADQPGARGDIDLPPANTKRWTIRRKAAVVLAVQRGVLSIEAACGRYRLSREEFAAWEQSIERHGIHGLRVTRFQIYRDTE